MDYQATTTTTTTATATATFYHLGEEYPINCAVRRATKKQVDTIFSIEKGTYEYSSQEVNCQWGKITTDITTLKPSRKLVVRGLITSDLIHAGMQLADGWELFESFGGYATFQRKPEFIENDLAQVLLLCEQQHRKEVKTFNTAREQAITDYIQQKQAEKDAEKAEQLRKQQQDHQQEQLLAELKREVNL